MNLSIAAVLLTCIDLAVIALLHWGLSLPLPWAIAAVVLMGVNLNAIRGRV